MTLNKATLARLGVSTADLYSTPKQSTLIDFGLPANHFAPSGGDFTMPMDEREQQAMQPPTRQATAYQKSLEEASLVPMDEMARAALMMQKAKIKAEMVKYAKPQAAAAVQEEYNALKAEYDRLEAQRKQIATREKEISGRLSDLRKTAVPEWRQDDQDKFLALMRQINLINRLLGVTEEDH